MRQVTLLVTVMVLFLGGATAAPTGLEVTTPHAVDILGGMTATGDFSTLWMDGLSGQPSIRLADAPSLRVDAHPHQAHVYGNADGDEIFAYDAIEPEPSRTQMAAATGRLTAASSEAAIRILTDQATSVTSQAATILKDARESEEFRHAEIGDESAGPEGEFGVVPTAAMLIQAREMQAPIMGPATVWLHGLVLEVAHEGGITTFDSRVDRTNVDVSAVEGGKATWTNHVLHLPTGATLDLIWPGNTFVFAEEAAFDVQGTLAFVAPDEGPVALDGPFHGSARWVSQSDGPATQWTLPAPATPASTASAPSSLSAVWLVSALALLLSGPALWFLLRRVRGTSAIQGHTEEQTDAIALYQAGRYKEALPGLEQLAAENNQDADVQFTYGICLLRAGDFRAAFGVLRSIVRANPVYLQLLVTRPETEEVRMDHRFEAFMRHEARIFQDGDHSYC